jgi:hypothetical protein
MKFEVYFNILINELFSERPFGGWIGSETELE